MTSSRARVGMTVSATAAPRIVIVTKRLDLGGAENHILRIMPELAACGFDMRLYVLERGGRLEPDLAAKGVLIEGLEKSTGRALHLAKAALHLSRFLRRHRPDAVHYFLPEPYMIGCVISPLAGRPVRIMSRRSLRDYQRRRPLFGRIETLLHSGTSVFLANSVAVADELRSETNRPDLVGLLQPLHLQTAYRNYPGVPGGLPVSERLATSVLSLPMHPYLDVETQDFIIAAVEAAIHSARS